MLSVVQSTRNRQLVQTAAFTITKIQPPRLRPNLIAREALERRLEDAVASRRLTLLSCCASG